MEENKSCVLHLVDWDEIIGYQKEVWGHKSCKGRFFKESFISEYEAKYKEAEEKCDVNVNGTGDDMEVDVSSPIRASCRSRYSNCFAGNRCIICNEIKYEKGVRVPLTLITLRDYSTKNHKAEEKLKEFAEIHIQNGSSSYMDGSKWIEL